MPLLNEYLDQYQPGPQAILGALGRPPVPNQHAALVKALGGGYAPPGKVNPLAEVQKFLAPPPHIKEAMDRNAAARAAAPKGKIGMGTPEDMALEAQWHGENMFGAGIMKTVGKGVPALLGAYRPRVPGALEALPQEKMTAGQARGVIAKTPGGVSADELEYTGVGKMLEGEGPVTKSGLQAQAEANPMRLVDEVKTSEPNLEAGLAEWKETYSQQASILEGAGVHPVVDDASTIRYRIDFGPGDPRTGAMFSAEEVARIPSLSTEAKRIVGSLDEIYDTTHFGGRNSTEYSSYQYPELPGGENYGEVAVRLERAPGTPGRPPSRSQVRLNEVEEELHAITATYPSIHERPRAVQQQAEALYDEQDLLQSTLRAAEETRGTGGDFVGSHYSEHKNVLGWFRHDEREVFVNGVKGRAYNALEFQSELHEKGAKQGYGSDGGMSAEEVQELTALRTQDAMATRETRGTPLTEVQYDRMLQLEDLADPTRPSGTVPDAPFKKNWPDLLFRRFLYGAAKRDKELRAAGKPGIDYVTWVPAEIPIKKWGKSKKIDAVRWRLNDDGTYDVNGWSAPPGNKHVLKETGLTTDRLSKLLGDETAQKMQDITARPGGGLADRARRNTLDGLNIEVGGKFFRDLYDNRIANAARKAAKKYRKGGAEVTKGSATKPAMPSLWALKVTPEMFEDILKGGVALGGAGLLGSQLSQPGNEPSGLLNMEEM